MFTFDANNPVLQPETSINLKELPTNSNGDKYFLVELGVFRGFNFRIIKNNRSHIRFTSVYNGTKYIKITLSKNHKGSIKYFVLNQCSLLHFYNQLKYIDNTVTIEIYKNILYSNNTFYGVESDFIAIIKGIARIEVSKELHSLNYDNMSKIKFTCFINCNKTDESYIKNTLFYSILSRDKYKLHIK